VGDALIVAGTPIEPWLRVQAAALTWPDSIVCFTSAAHVHHLPVPVDDAVHVIVPHRRASRGGLMSHRLPVEDHDVVRVGLALVTTLQRTLFDCIGRLPTAESERLVTWAATRERLDAAALRGATDARRGAWGNPARRRALDDVAVGAYNAAERRLQTILRAAGIHGWQGDQRLDLPGRVVRVDVLFRRERLVLEVDGFGAHGSQQFQSDRSRQNALVAAGYTVLRFTWWDLVDRPADVARQVRATLAVIDR
jgi:very-short-patch-repair endonuclease